MKKIISTTNKSITNFISNRFDGNTRTVIVIKKKIVIKLPKTDPLYAFARIKYTIKRFGILAMLKNTFLSPDTDIMSIKYALFRGILANYREYKLWKRSKHKLLVPTYFSALGLFNIQPFGKPNYRKIWDLLLDTTNYSLILQKDSHTFGENDNWVIIDNHLKLADYGSRFTPQIIKQFGKSLMSAINRSK